MFPINNNHNYDVVIIGAGPIGITTASLLKTLNKDLKICVLDKRSEPTRKHGLNIRADSMNRLLGVIKEAFNNVLVDKNQADALSSIFKSWKANFIRTNEIEDQLKAFAVKAGITVLRNDAYAPYLEDSKIEENFNETGAADKEQNDLKNIFRNARVIVGADGSHSTVRNQILKTKLVEEKTFQYLVELKYETEGETAPRGYKLGSSEMVVCGNINIASVASQKAEKIKAATLHIFVDKQTFDLLRPTNEQGKITKGLHASPWNLKEINELGKKNNRPKIKHLYAIMKNHITKLKERNGSLMNEKISTIPLSISRSERSVGIYQNKPILLVGDANSGLVLERGVNKGFHEVAFAVGAIIEYLKTPEEVTENRVVPRSFKKYEEETQNLFTSEKRWINFKSFWIEIARTILSIIYRLFFLPYQTSSRVAAETT